MKRIEVKSMTLSKNPVTVKEAFTLTVDAQDVEIVFGTDYKYARAYGYEIYAGEEGVI